MKRLFYLLTIALFAACSGSDDEVNTLPVIKDISANTDLFGIGQTYVLKCDATDSDGDELHYKWSDGVKEIEGVDSVTWTPKEVGEKTFTVTVTDNKGEVVEKTVTYTAQYCDFRFAFIGDAKEDILEYEEKGIDLGDRIGPNIKVVDNGINYYSFASNKFHFGTSTITISLSDPNSMGGHYRQHISVLDNLKERYGNPTKEEIIGDNTGTDDEKGVKMFNQQLSFSYEFETPRAIIKYWTYKEYGNNLEVKFYTEVKAKD